MTGHELANEILRQAARVRTRMRSLVCNMTRWRLLALAAKNAPAGKTADEAKAFMGNWATLHAEVLRMDELVKAWAAADDGTDHKLDLVSETVDDVKERMGSVTREADEMRKSITAAMGGRSNV